MRRSGIQSRRWTHAGGLLPPGVAAASAAAVYDPIFSEAGGAEEFCPLLSEVELTSAGISSPEDISTGSWTRTQCTAVGTTGLTVDVAATAPTIAQTINNCGAGNPCVPVLICFRAKFTSIQWIVVTSRSATAANQTFFDIQNGVVGTNGANHTDATIGAADGDGYRLVYLYSATNGGVPVVKIEFSSTDTTITAPVATSRVDLKQDDTNAGWCQQTCIQRIFGRVHGTELVQVTRDTMPGFGITPFADKFGINGHNAMRSTGTQRMISTVCAEILSALSGTGKAYTLYIKQQFFVDDAIADMVSVGNSAAAAAGSRDWGTSTSGGGRYAMVTTADATPTGDVSTVASVDIASDRAPKLLVIDSDGSTMTWEDNGTVVTGMNAAAHNPGANTANQFGIFCRAGSSQTNRQNCSLGSILIFGAQHDAAAKTRVKANLNSRWA